MTSRRQLLRGHRQRRSVRSPARPARDRPRGSPQRRGPRPPGRSRAAAGRAPPARTRVPRQCLRPPQPVHARLDQRAGRGRGTAYARLLQGRRCSSSIGSPSAAARASAFGRRPTAGTARIVSTAESCRQLTTRAALADDHLRIGRPSLTPTARACRAARPPADLLRRERARRHGERDAERRRLRDEAIGDGQRREPASDGERVHRHPRPGTSSSTSTTPTAIRQARARRPHRAAPRHARARAPSGPGGRAP